MRLDERVQPYVFCAGFLYVSCPDHIKLDHGLIHALMKRWRRETHTFHLRHEEMTSTLQDPVVLLGLAIDERAITSSSVHSKIMLYERSF